LGLLVLRELREIPEDLLDLLVLPDPKEALVELLERLEFKVLPDRLVPAVLEVPPVLLDPLEILALLELPAR
jgi:hypothetical protein